MTVVWRSSSAGMLVPVAEHISAATLPVACVDLVPPVPGRAGKLRSLTDDAGSRKRARYFWRRARLLMATGPEGAVDTQEPSAEGRRPAR